MTLWSSLQNPRLAERQFVGKGVPRTLHLNVVRFGGGFRLSHLAFRDYLEKQRGRGAGIRTDQAAAGRAFPKRPGIVYKWKAGIRRKDTCDSPLQINDETTNICTFHTFSLVVTFCTNKTADRIGDGPLSAIRQDRHAIGRRPKHCSVDEETV